MQLAIRIYRYIYNLIYLCITIIEVKPFIITDPIGSVRTSIIGLSSTNTDTKIGTFIK